VSAVDTCGGDLSDAVVVGGDVVGSATPGTYVVTYAVADSAENAAPPVTRTVVVSDTMPPVLELLGEAEVTLECGAVYEELGALAMDACEGPLGIALQGIVDSHAPGIYTVVYSAQDSKSQRAAVERTIVVEDNCAAEGEGEGEFCPAQPVHHADQDGSFTITLNELLRLIQFFNSAGFGCQAGTEDGFAPNELTKDCCPHTSDYAPRDWQINLTELLRLIQFFNSGGYHYCPANGTEDGYCPGQS
jgi:hypothetical protein